VSFDTEREAIVNAIQQALAKHRQEKAMIEKRVAGDQQRLRELDAVIAALEAIPPAPAPGPAGKSNSSPS
jgi:hypothetical protein